MLCAAWATQQRVALSLVARLSSWLQLGMQTRPQQAVPGLSLVPADCCSFQAWCRRRVALTAQSWAAQLCTAQAAAAFRAAAEQARALLGVLQTLSRVEQQGCMHILHQQGNDACSQRV